MANISEKDLISSTLRRLADNVEESDITNDNFWTTLEEVVDEWNETFSDIVEQYSD